MKKKSTEQRWMKWKTNVGEINNEICFFKEYNSILVILIQGQKQSTNSNTRNLKRGSTLYI